MMLLKEVINMLKKLFKDYGLILLFYLFLVLCILILNARYSYLNVKIENNYTSSSNN